MTVLRLPFQKPPLTPNQRLHYAQKAALTAQIRHAATQCAKAAHIAPAGRSAVTTVWFPPDKRRRDANSLVLTALRIHRRTAPSGLKTSLDLVKSSVTAGATNTLRPLTHSLEQARRG